MRIDFLGLQAFLALAERGSFRRAAASLNLSQTAVSHRMRKLEDELGVRLFVRTTREVTLSRAGLEFLPKAQKALAALETTFDDMRQQGSKRRNRIAIACLPAFAVYYLPKALNAFHALYPGVEVRIFETPSTDIAGLVQSGEVEFGLSVVSTNRWDLEIHPIASDPFVLACPAGYPIARRRSVRWSDLAGLPLIRVSGQTAIRTIIDDMLGTGRDGLNWCYEVQRVETAVNFVANGLGATIVPKINVDLQSAKGVVARPMSEPALSCTFGVVSKRGSPLSAVAEHLRDVLVERMRERSRTAKIAS